MQEMHMSFGSETVVLSVAHSAFHLARIAWRQMHHQYIIWDDHITQTGSIALVFLVLGTVPMCGLGKRLIPVYEIRMSMHALLVVFLAVLTQHGPECTAGGDFDGSRVLYFVTTLLGLYALHLVASYLFRTYEVVDYQLFPVGNGTVIEFEYPSNLGGRFAFSSGQYLKVCVPWISKLQWHPFSAIHVAGVDNREMCALYCADVGWWTHQMYCSTLLNRKQPIWIHGPISSTFDTVKDHDYAILVASGAGITPVMSALSDLNERRGLFLIWICRQPALIDYFHAYFCKIPNLKARIFLTGAGSVPVPVGVTCGTNVTVTTGSRPDVARELDAIIGGVTFPLPGSTTTRSATAASSDLVYATPQSERVAPASGIVCSNTPTYAVDTVRATPPTPLTGQKMTSLATALSASTRPVRDVQVHPSEWCVMYSGASNEMADGIADYCKKKNIIYKREGR
jgi:ferredoxin-NADP reductase